MKRLADKVRRRFVAGIENEDALVQKLPRAQPAALMLAFDQAGEHVSARPAGTTPAIGAEPAVEEVLRFEGQSARQPDYGDR